MKVVRIGTRKSKLAMWQAEWVQSYLSKLYPHTRFEIITMETKGDQILDVPLPKIGDKGLFTLELEQALFSGEIDMAVHSLKDLPTTLAEGLELAAFCEREDPRDVLISKTGEGLEQLPPGAVVATSSLRRKTQIQNFRQDLAFTDLRGNLQTRWRKLQEADKMTAIVLAAAGVIRLGWEDRITEYIPEDLLVPAVGQGVIAVEIASKRTDVSSLLKPLNHSATELAVRAERCYLRALDGGCQVPIGALAAVKDEVIILKGIVASLDGRTVLKTLHTGHDPEKVGKEAAEKMKCQGAGELLVEARKQIQSNEY